MVIIVIKFLLKIKVGRLIISVHMYEKIDNQKSIGNKRYSLYSYLKHKFYYLHEKYRTSIFFKEIYIKNVGLIDIAIFCRMFAELTGAGLSVPQSLLIIRKQTLNPKLKKAMTEVYDIVQKGGALSKAMETFSEFPGFLVNMLEAGEASGQMEETLKAMASYYEKQNSLSRKIRNALIYPTFVSICAIGIIVLLVVKILPEFAEIFQSMGAKMPTYSTALISISYIIAEYWPVILMFTIITIYILKKCMGTDRGKYIYHKLLLNLPAVGPLIKKVIASKFSGTLAMLLKNGVNIIQAMSILENSFDNSAAGRCIRICKRNLEQGWSLSAALSSVHIFPEMLVSMVSVGEESGTLDDVLYRISSYYEEDVEASSGRVSSIIEPIIMIILGVMVYFIIMSVMLPMLDMYGLIN